MMKLNKLLQHAKIILQIEDLEEQAFVNKTMYQTSMENRTKHNSPLMMVINTKIWLADRVHVMQTSESKIKHNCHPILLP